LDYLTAEARQQGSPPSGRNLGLKTAPAQARDLWAHSDLKLDGAEYSVTVPAHGVVMLHIAK